MRLKEFKSALARSGISAAILYGRDGVKEYNIEYFTDSYPLSACRLLIWAKGEDSFLVPKLELERMRKLSRIKVKELKKDWQKGLERKTIGFNANYLSVNELKSLKKLIPAKFVDISHELSRLREIKTKEEIARIKKACQISDSILGKFAANARKFKTEKKAAKFLLDKIEEIGLEPSFPPIIAAGKNAVNPHHEPSNSKLEGFCVVDFGVKYKGYCSDTTRTFYFGKISREEKEIYNRVLNSQMVGLGFAKTGIRGKDLDYKVRNSFGNLGKYFIHSTGHSVGREIHDIGTGVHKNENRKLAKGMIVTIEPGIYVPNKFGIRIEDTVIVEEKNATPLTKFAKKLVLIE
ncbi:MAG: aminopeptidase P family protein [Nanoarchaeota archaeon]|nr:MAG: aminopeptidase P family protein [Nanoarchaeota archaeon]